MNKSSRKKVLTVLCIIGMILLWVLSYKESSPDEILKSIVTIVVIFLLKEFMKKNDGASKRLK